MTENNTLNIMMRQMLDFPEFTFQALYVQIQF